MARIKQVRTRYIEHHARRAIAHRLGCAVPRAVFSVTRDNPVAGMVIVLVNSGANTRATKRHRRCVGYRVEPTHYDPFAAGPYGMQLRVGPVTTAAQET